MNAYRQQQLAAAALIESGADAETIAAVYGWTAKPPPEIEPVQSGTTGHNQTLTPRQKCGIIKAIKRHVRRWKRKQEGKKMANWKKQREIALAATEEQLINSDTGRNDYGYHISTIDGVNTPPWRYHRQTASNEYEAVEGVGNATHIIITDIPNFSDYNKGVSMDEYEIRIIPL